jgi:hypothetical protein
VHGLDLVKQGIIWRIGLGSKVNIWRDPWICRSPSRKITLKKGRGRMRWVSQLMVPGRHEWNEQILHECMYLHDVVEVLKIRLSKRVQADHIAWFYDRSGIFTTRSAYNLAVRIEKGLGEREGSSSRTDGTRPMYADIWKANVPAKVRIFVWRLAQKGLATRVNRRARKMETEAKCQLCGKEEGVRLAAQWIKQPLLVELDCTLLLQEIMREEVPGCRSHR